MDSVGETSVSFQYETANDTATTARTQRTGRLPDRGLRTRRGSFMKSPPNGTHRRLHARWRSIRRNSYSAGNGRKSDGRFFVPATHAFHPAEAGFPRPAEMRITPAKLLMPLYRNAADCPRLSEPCSVPRRSSWQSLLREGRPLRRNEAAIRATAPATDPRDASPSRDPFRRDFAFRPPASGGRTTPDIRPCER